MDKSVVGIAKNIGPCREVLDSTRSHHRPYEQRILSNLACEHSGDLRTTLDSGEVQCDDYVVDENSKCVGCDNGCPECSLIVE